MTEHISLTRDSIRPPHGGACDVQVRWIEQTVVLSVCGQLDMLSAPYLLGAIHDAFDKAPSVLIIDLTELDFMASMGMSVLAAAHEQAGRTTRFGVVADGPSTARPVELIGMDSFLWLYLTLDDALHNLS
jgi:anti-sigma B factor antagonist